MNRTYLAAACQMDTGADLQANLAQTGELLAQASARGAQLAALPEYFNCLGDQTVPEPLDGPSITFLQNQAQTHHLWINCGSFTEANPEGLPYNTSVLIDADGEIKAVYRKMHLFDIMLKTQTTSLESSTRAAGNCVVIKDSPFGSLGLSVCYDIRFPELYRIMALRGAQVFFTPANFLMNTGKDHWEPILRTRAIENGCYVIAPCQTGKKTRSTSLGRTVIVDPWGNVIAQAGEGVGLAMAQVDLDYLNSIRQQIPSLQNRRGDIYQVDTI